MKRLYIIAALVLALSLLLVSCSEPRTFEKVDVVTTEPQTTEAVTYKYSEASVMGVKMGMSVEETQQIIGISSDIYLNESGVAYFAINKKGLDFVSPELECSVYFIFDGNLRLCEIQYISTDDTGFSLKDATGKYDSLYGKHVSVQSDAGKVNYVWYTGGIYAVITSTTEKQYAMSFFGEDYFKQAQPEEYEAYNK